MSADAMNLVKRMISDHTVVVFSKTYCPYCDMAKKALTNVGAKYEVVELDTRNDGASLQQALSQLTGRSTVPNVFVGE